MTKTKTEGLWSRFADMLQGNKELCRRLHQQAVTEGGVMPKTCRTCGSLQGYCHVAGVLPLDGGTFGCSEGDDKRKPLLVGELAEALYWLLNLHHNVSKAGNDPETGQPYPVTGEEWKAAIDEGMRVHARHQKEVGDA